MVSEFDKNICLLYYLHCKESQEKRKKPALLPQEVKELRPFVLKQVNARRKYESFLDVKDIVPLLSKKQKAVIDTLVAESPFTRNRRRRFRRFLLELVRWKHFITGLPMDMLMLYARIYPRFYLASIITPLPFTLLARWAGQGAPARKKTEAFTSEIVECIGSFEEREFVVSCYRHSNDGGMMILRQGLKEAAIEKLEGILERIEYRNNSGTKYIYFLNYLIEKRILELEVNYSTHGMCKWYKVYL